MDKVKKLSDCCSPGLVIRIILIANLIFVVCVCPVVILVKIGILGKQFDENCNGVEKSASCAFTDFLTLPSGYFRDERNHVIEFFTHAMDWAGSAWIPVLCTWVGIFVIIGALLLILPFVHSIHTNRKYKDVGWMLQYLLLVIWLIIIQFCMAVLFMAFSVHGQNIVKASLVDFYSDLDYYNYEDGKSFPEPASKNPHYEYLEPEGWTAKIGEGYKPDKGSTRWTLMKLKCCGVDSYKEFMNNNFGKDRIYMFPETCCVNSTLADPYNENNYYASCPLANGDSPHGVIYTESCYQKIVEPFQQFGDIGILGFKLLFCQIVFLQVIAIFFLVFQLCNAIVGYSRRRRDYACVNN